MEDSIYRLRHGDILTLCVLGLLALGIVMVQSASMNATGPLEARLQDLRAKRHAAVAKTTDPGEIKKINQDYAGQAAEANQKFHERPTHWYWTPSGVKQAGYAVAALLDGHGEAKAGIGVVRLVTPEVEVDPGCPRHHPDHAQVARGLGGQDARAVDPVREGAGVDEQLDERVELASEALEVLAQLPPPAQGQLALHASDGDRAAHQPRAEEALLQGDQALPQDLRPARGDAEGHVGGDGADVGDVVVDALQLEEHDAQVAPSRVRELYQDLGSSDKVFIDLGCSGHSAMWEKNHELMFRASLEWLTRGTVEGMRSGVVRLGY